MKLRLLVTEENIGTQTDTLDSKDINIDHETIASILLICAFYVFSLAGRSHCAAWSFPPQPSPSPGPQPQHVITSQPPQLGLPQVVPPQYTVLHGVNIGEYTFGFKLHI